MKNLLERLTQFDFCMNCKLNVYTTDNYFDVELLKLQRSGRIEGSTFKNRMRQGITSGRILIVACFISRKYFTR